MIHSLPVLNGGEGDAHLKYSNSFRMQPMCSISGEGYNQKKMREKRVCLCLFEGVEGGL